jgi:hypothetical protein
MFDTDAINTLSAACLSLFGQAYVARWRRRLGGAEEDGVTVIAN